MWSGRPRSPHRGTSVRKGRLVVSVATALVVLATAPGTSVFTCLHHAGHAGAAADHEAHYQVGPADHEAHTTKEGRRHGADDSSSHADQEGHEDDGGRACVCPGWCPASGAPSAPAANEERGLDLPRTRVARVAAPAHAPPHSRPAPYVLPFANPPPLS